MIINDGDFGHWSILETEDTKEEIDLAKYIGFVYVMSFDNGTKYIGAKKIWKRIKNPPNTFKRGPQKGFEQSDWRTYQSSSNEVNYMIENGHKPVQYLIVGFYETWGMALMAEAFLQFNVNIFMNRDIWLNGQIDGKFIHNSWNEKILHDKNVYFDYLYNGKGNIFDYSIILNVMDERGNISECNLYNDFEYNEGRKLIDGVVDEVNGFTLTDDIRRVDWTFEYKDGKYKNATECSKATGIKRKDFEKFGVKEVEKETRKDYKARLSKKDFYKIKRSYY